VSTLYADWALVYADLTQGDAYYIHDLSDEGMPVSEVHAVKPGHGYVLTLSGGMDPYDLVLVEVVKGRHGVILMRELCRGCLKDETGAAVTPVAACLNGSFNALASDFVDEYQRAMHNFQKTD